MDWLSTAVTAATSVSIALALGVYATVVIDHVFGRAIAGEPLRLALAFVQPLRGSALLLLQQRSRTERPDTAAWALAPSLLGALAAAALVVVPLAPAVALEIQSGIVYFGAAMATVMVAVFLNGWSANSTFPLIGGYRFVAQALSFEMPLVLVLIAAALPAESLNVTDIVRSQEAMWNVLRQPLGLPLFLIAAVGVSFSGPLSFPDGMDLAGGTTVELSGTALLVWRAAQASVLVAAAAMGAAVFLGGWFGPWFPGPVWMAVKTLLLISVMVAMKHLFARVRLERFVVVSWVILIPVALIDVFLSGLLALRGIGS